MTAQRSFSQQSAELPQGAEQDVPKRLARPPPMGKGANQARWDVQSTNTSEQAGDWATVNANQYNSYNTYGVLWIPRTLTFYYDGKAVARTPTPSDFTQKMYTIANVAVGGTWPGSAKGENATMKIDCIRPFSNNSAIPAIALHKISSPDGGEHSLYGATAASTASSQPPRHSRVLTLTSPALCLYDGTMCPPIKRFRRASHKEFSWDRLILPARAIPG